MHDDFDVLMVLNVVGGLAQHLFVIPMHELRRRAYVGAEAASTSLSLYPPSVTPHYPAGRDKQKWQAPYHFETSCGVIHGDDIARLQGILRSL